MMLYIILIYYLFQAFMIAYTSDFIPRLVYMFTSKDHTLNGYINSSLSIFDTRDFNNETRPLESMLDDEKITVCRYLCHFKKIKTACIKLLLGIVNVVIISLFFVILNFYFFLTLFPSLTLKHYLRFF